MTWIAQLVRALIRYTRDPGFDSRFWSVLFCYNGVLLHSSDIPTPYSHITVHSLRFKVIPVQEVQRLPHDCSTQRDVEPCIHHPFFHPQSTGEATWTTKCA